MQQTEKLQLDLIESTDAFSPEPLNKNMEKLEDVLSELVTHTHFVATRYSGTGKKLKITLGFRPSMVIIARLFTGYTSTSSYGATTVFMDGPKSSIMTFLDDGFELAGQEISTFPPANVSGVSYSYIAFR